MSKLVVINLGSGDLQNGCLEVTAQTSSIGSDSLHARHPLQSRGRLPPAPEIEQLYQRWQLLYREFYRERNSRSQRTIQIESGGVTHFSEVEFRDLTRQLKKQLNAWLDSESYHPIDRKLSRVLDPSDEIRLIIETNNDLLRRLPWHLWNFFEDYPKAEIALSALEYGQVKPNQTSPGQVRILAILGNSDNIDIGADRRVIEDLPGAAPFFLESPSRRELDKHLWDRRGWDILFFAGHSETEGETGRIYINQKKSVPLEQLRNGLKKAIRHGLKLAIFNSCDGLGLARDLANLHIPQVIVMRSPVPDVVAQEFFRNFLAAFSSGQSLYASVREAREKLEGLEDDYPCATWLPVICQNPAAVPATWHEWRGSRSGARFFSQRLQFALLASIIASTSIMGVRQLGILQAWELQTYDQLMRLRPDEEPDPRLLVVSVTEEDVRMQNLKERRSLSDPTLAKLLSKLRQYQPQVIGLDIYRDFPVDPKQTDLATYLQDQNFIAVCDVGGEDDYRGIGSPPEIPADRLSFSDLPLDPDRVVRRQLLGMAPDPQSFCQTDTSFSFRVAQTYLAAQGFEGQPTPQRSWQIGGAVFQQLQPKTGGYHQLDARGYQVMLNYRAADPVAQQVTLTEILSGSLDAELPSLVKDRIVLIGTTAKSFKDYFPTPYSAGHWHQELPGIDIHAHMVSQILSAVLERRPLVWWLPQWGEIFWIWGWSLVGTVLIWRRRSPLSLGLALGLTLGALYGLCFVFLLKGGWMPLVPSALALIVTSSSVVVYTAFQPKTQ